ncbi:MAG TPA: hemerythrin domain-containing protein [Burkholderiaceae bacterium]
MAIAKTARHSSPRPAARAARPVPAPDALKLLKEDHARVDALFEQYAKSRSPAKKQAIVASICRELSVHAQVEEEIFYPAVKAALKDRELVPEAIVEHATLKEFIAKVQDRLPDGEMFDAQIQVMGEYVRHHVKEEQTEMFPKVRKTSLDLKELGARLAARKDELTAEPQALAPAPTAVADLPA